MAKSCGIPKESSRLGEVKEWIAMKQELRRTFDDLGQNHDAVTSFVLTQAVEATVTLLPLRRGRGEHYSPVALVQRNPSELKVRSDQLTCRILMGLLDDKKFIITPEFGL